MTFGAFKDQKIKQADTIASNPTRYFRVEKGNENYRIHGWTDSGEGYTTILEATYKKFLKYEIINPYKMVFDLAKFKVVHANLRFQTHFRDALVSLEKTGRFPDGTVPAKDS